MAKYESNIKQINAPVQSVYATLCNLENLRPIVERARDNEELKAKIKEAGQDPTAIEMLGKVTLTPDRITLPSPMMGDMSLAIVEREENKCIKFHTEQSPVDANLWIQVLPVTDTTSKMRLTLKADLNPMVKMMIGSKIEQGLEQFAEMLARIPYA